MFLMRTIHMLLKIGIRLTCMYVCRVIKVFFTCTDVIIPVEGKLNSLLLLHIIL